MKLTIITTIFVIMFTILLHSCSSTTLTKNVRTVKMDSLAWYWTMLYLPDGTDTAVIYRSPFPPAKIQKDGLWVTLLYVNDSLLILDVPGKMYLKQNYNEEYYQFKLLEQQEEEYKKQRLLN